MSISFVIDATSGPSAFQLDLVRTDELLIHEEVLENAVKNIEANITRMGIRYDPIVIDEKTSVVLDGTHRTAVARMLKLRFVLAMKVDYFDNRIQLGVWNRVFRGEFDSVVGLPRRIRMRSLWDKSPWQRYR